MSQQTAPPEQPSPHSQRTWAELYPVISFTIFYLCAATLFAYWRGNAEFVFYIVVMLILIGVVAEIHRRIRLSHGVIWCLSVWGALHMAGGLLALPEAWPRNGEINVLYNLWLIPEILKYDQAVHVFGFAATTWLCWQSLQSIAGVTNTPLCPSLGALLLCGAAGMGFGALNEVIEFAATLLIPHTNVGGYENTGWDLVSNLAGCVIAAAWIALAKKTKFAEGA